MEFPFVTQWDLQNNPPSEEQRLIAEFYDEMKDSIEQVSMATFVDDMLGDSICGYYLLHDIQLLLIYLLLLNKKISEVRATSECGILTTEMKKELIDSWKLECIRKTFRCKGVKINKVIKLDILPAYRVFDVATVTGDTGIDYMYIEGPEADPCAGQKETFYVR